MSVASDTPRGVRLVPRLLDVLIGLLMALGVWTLLADGVAIRVAGRSLGVSRAQDVVLAIVAVLALRWWLALPRVRVARPTRLVVSGVIVYTLVFSLITVGQHRSFRTHAMDLGYYVQVIWELGHGLVPHETLLEQHAWAGHLSPILYLLAPLGRLPHLPEVLLVLQSLALALGAVPLYLLGRPRVGDAWASALSLLYLINPSLHGITTKDFHTAALAIPLLLVAMYAVEAGRAWLFWPATVLTLATREDAAIAVVGLGLWIALARRRAVLGAGAAGLGLVWLFASVQWIMPVFRGEPYPYLAARYGHLGDSLGAIVLSPLLRPRAVVATLLSLSRLRYLGALLAPLGFLPLAAPVAAVGALPALAQNLLNTDPVLFNFRTQYQSFVLPFLLVATVCGVQTIVAGRGARPCLGTRALALAVLASLALTARTVNALAPGRWGNDDGARAAARLMAAIPPSAAVSAEERFFPHLARRARVYVFPTGLERSDYAFVSGASLAAGTIGRVPARREDSAVIFSVRADVAGADGRALRFQIVDEAEGFLLLRPTPASR